MNTTANMDLIDGGCLSFPFQKDFQALGASIDFVGMGQSLAFQRYSQQARRRVLALGHTPGSTNFRGFIARPTVAVATSRNRPSTAMGRSMI